MSRGLWFVAGAGAGVYAMVRGRRAAEALSIDGLRDRAGAAALGARMLGAEVAAGKAEREVELRQQMQQRGLRAVDPARAGLSPTSTTHHETTTTRHESTSHQELTGRPGRDEQGD